MSDKLLTKEDILKASDIKSECVLIPEWNGSVKVYGMTAAEKDAYEESLFDRSDKGSKMNLSDARAKLIVATVKDESGMPMFNVGNIVQLGKKSAKAIDRIVDVAKRLSGMSDEEFEGIAKNSEKALPEDSSSDQQGI